MKPGRLIGMGVMAAGIFLLAGAVPAVAEEAAGWRPVYDTVMLWVNFLILVFVIVKFGRPPLKRFFENQREAVAGEIKALEEARDKTAAELQETRSRIEEGDAHIATIKERIVSEGERMKQKIIDDAQKQSEFMVADAKRKVAHQFQEARKKFRSDLIDMAVDAAAEKLNREIQPEDQKYLLNYYFQVLSEKSTTAG